MMSSFGDVSHSGNREQYTKKEYLIYGGIGFLIIILFALYALELQKFDRYTNLSLFVKVALSGGFLIGVGLAFYLKKQAVDATEVMQVFIFCIVSCMAFAPLIFSLINRSICLDSYQKEVQIVMVDTRYVSRFGKMKDEKSSANRLVVNYLYKGKTHEYATHNMRYYGMKRGDEATLTFEKGLLGFEYSLPYK